ncbi:hypothetical protein ACFXNW_10770 [Nocardia sp. NPDC059180]|uniref:hypothetical protein n=1 Tax=Nocardia sp. NPDC059180 TaxID=3346761 RepID=UPI0036969810
MFNYADDLPDGVTQDDIPNADNRPETKPVPPHLNPAMYLPDEFWESHGILRHVRDYSFALGASPDAALYVALANLVANVYPEAKIKSPLGDASMNLYVAVVGSSGHGKGKADGAGRSALQIVKNMDELTPWRGFGTGEGVLKEYAELNNGNRLFFHAPEADQMISVGSRNSATLNSVLRQGWLAEGIGFTNKGTAYREPPLDEHSYRMCISVGLQPEKSGPLFADGYGGLPQRFLYAPVSAPGLLALGEIPEEIPNVAVWQGFGNRHPSVTLEQSIRTEVRVQRFLMNTGQLEVDPLDTHVMLNRLKAAAALAYLIGKEPHVTEEIWGLAGLMIERSCATRDYALSVLHEKRMTAASADGKVLAHRDDVRDDARELKLKDRTYERVRAVLAPDGTKMTEGALARKISTAQREVLPEVLDVLVERGVLGTSEGEFWLKS